MALSGGTPPFLADIVGMDGVDGMDVDERGRLSSRAASVEASGEPIGGIAYCARGALSMATMKRLNKSNEDKTKRGRDETMCLERAGYRARRIPNRTFLVVNWSFRPFRLPCFTPGVLSYLIGGHNVGPSSLVPMSRSV